MVEPPTLVDTGGLGAARRSGLVLMAQESGGARGNKKGGKAAGGGGKKTKDREWLLRKKARMRHKGYEGIPADTKYSGRKRRRVT